MTLERTAPPVSDAMTAALARRLRLPEGFHAEPEAEAALRDALAAAVEAVEARTGLTLAPRRMTARTVRWGTDGTFAFPRGPVRAVVRVAAHDADGAERVVDAAGLRVLPGRPERLWGDLPAVACGGEAEVVFEAGFGAAWEDAPADLREAALALAAAVHEGRPGAAWAEVAALTAPHLAGRL